MELAGTDRVRELTEREPIRLGALSWPLLQALQGECAGLLLIPVGATEQHGPHLPVETDTVLAEAACAYASAETGVPVAPSMAYTSSAGHTAKWPGTFALPHQTFIEACVSLGNWALATGWKRLLFVNAHYGNDAPLRIAVDRLRLEHMGRLQVGLVHTFNVSEEVWAAYVTDAADYHANRAETDLLLYLAPGTVDMRRAEDDPDRTIGTVFSYPVAQTSTNGLTGMPSGATAEAGRKLFIEIGRALTAKVRAALTETPPLEPAHWAAAASATPWP